MTRQKIASNPHYDLDSTQYGGNGTIESHRARNRIEGMRDSPIDDRCVHRSLVFSIR